MNLQQNSGKLRPFAGILWLLAGRAGSAPAVLHPIGAVSLLLPFPEQWPRGTALLLRDAPRECQGAWGAGKYRFVQYNHWNSVKPGKATTPKPKQLSSALGRQARCPRLAAPLSTAPSRAAPLPSMPQIASRRNPWYHFGGQGKEEQP